MSDWYDLSYSSLSFCMPGEYLVVLLFIGPFFGLVRSVVLVAIVITDVKVLWKSLMFLIILLRLASLVAFSITCIAFFAIFLICVVVCFTIAIIRMITVTIVCRGGVMFGLFSFLASCVNCISAMSHARSGNLLFGTAFLPSLVFPVCSSSYSLQTFSVMGIFLMSLRCTLVMWP